MCIQSLQEENDRWIDYLQKALTTSRKKEEEEEKYQEVTIGEQGIFNLIYEAKEAVITLTIYQKEIDSEIQKLTQTLNQQHTLPTEVTKPTPPTYTNVNLPQLSLSVFNGDPRQWREFWSSFNAAIHSQTVLEIQKLNYLISCLKGSALQAVRGFDIAPQNHEVVRKLLTEKYGDSSMTTKLLYNELRSIKRNEKEWIEAVEKKWKESSDN
uniref:Gag protein n=1 Tax=Loa loa TaxID=7209 RepID=A0A1I7W069_LOALO